MIAFEAPLTGEVPESAQVQSWHRRTMVAVMALLMAIAAVTLVSTNNQIPLNHSVLACGSTPGFCPNPPKSTSAINHTAVSKGTTTAGDFAGAERSP
ncbi:MAG: hypothetical protein ACRDRO_00485 [Pseudonocardiaceae bacterium]